MFLSFNGIFTYARDKNGIIPVNFLHSMVLTVHHHTLIYLLPILSTNLQFQHQMAIYQTVNMTFKMNSPFKYIPLSKFQTLCVP